MSTARTFFKAAVEVARELAAKKGFTGYLTLAYPGEEGFAEFLSAPIGMRGTVKTDTDGSSYDARNVGLAKASLVLETGEPTGRTTEDQLADYQPKWCGGIPLTRTGLTGMALSFCGVKEVEDEDFCMEIQRTAPGPF